MIVEVLVTVNGGIGGCRGWSNRLARKTESGHFDCNGVELTDVLPDSERTATAEQIALFLECEGE